MRSAFIRKLVELAEQDQRIFLLTGDLGFMALEPFANRFPDRFINVGVAEQNMIGIATGLAGSGFIPFVYSIATFAVLRPYEFIRNGPIAHHLPVKVIGVGGGFEYSHNGLSHFALEDIAVMRAQPDVGVVAPADSAQAVNALEATWNSPGPTYYRLGKNSDELIPNLNGDFACGRIARLHEGRDALVLSMGTIAAEAERAIQQLSNAGIQCTHGIVASVHPSPYDSLLELASRFSQIFTVEAHYARGGLFSLVSEVIAENGINARVYRSAVEKIPDGETGDLDFMYSKHALCANQLAAKIKTSILKTQDAFATRTIGKEVGSLTDAELVEATCHTR